MPHEELPFWHFNVPRLERTASCPDYLINVSDKDRNLIGQWDSDYEPMTWSEVKSFVYSNNLQLFRRSPSNLRLYRKFVHDISTKHGSVLNFMLRYRLHWDTVKPFGAPFTDDRDVKVLYNDWPYGVAAGIVHLVVWTRFPLPDDPVTGHLTDEMRLLVSEFVEDNFSIELGHENVVWFKNWKKLKSVQAIEHFHVLLHNPTQAFLDRITGGDKPIHYV